MKNSALIFFNILIAITLVCFSCEDENETANIYEGCCDILPIEMDFNPGKIYIPNIFTPNNDGKNDWFYPLVNQDIVKIDVFKIFGSDNSLLHQYYDISPATAAFGFSWHPYENSNTTYKGKFKYYFKVTNSQGNTFELEGSACSFVCDEANPFDFFSNCGFLEQHDGHGQFDPISPNLEPECP